MFGSVCFFFQAAIVGHEQRESPDGCQIAFHLDALFECVCDADVPRCAVDRGTPDLVDKKGRFRPVRRTADGAAGKVLAIRGNLDAAGQLQGGGGFAGDLDG